jgi:hypothetical protein
VRAVTVLKADGVFHDTAPRDSYCHAWNLCRGCDVGGGRGTGRRRIRLRRCSGATETADR